MFWGGSENVVQGERETTGAGSVKLERQACRHETEKTGNYLTARRAWPRSGGEYGYLVQIPGGALNLRQHRASLCQSGVGGALPRKKAVSYSIGMKIKKIIKFLINNFYL
jgi:hypothetical protein